MLSIRKASLKDIPTIVNMWKEFMAFYKNTIIKQDPKLKPYLRKKKNIESIFKKFVEKHIHSKNGMVHIAEVDSKPVGYSVTFIKHNFPFFYLKKIGYISEIFVKKKFRGMEISSKLKDKAIKWFREKKIKYISIAVYDDNKLAHSIYKKWGFFDYYTDMRKKI